METGEAWARGQDIRTSAVDIGGLTGLSRCCVGSQKRVLWTSLEPREEVLTRGENEVTRYR